MEQGSETITGDKRLPDIAVFDLDGTITRRDTFRAFLVFALRRRPGRLIHAWRPALALIRAALGDDIRGRVKAALAGMLLSDLNPDELDRLIETFLDESCMSLVRTDATAIIADHRQQGRRLILATASLDLYILPLAERLGFPEVVCTRCARDGEGRITGYLNGANCLSKEKLRQLVDMLGPERNEVLVTVYSDHHADIPLLSWADTAVAVNPTPRLTEVVGIKVEMWS